MTKIITMKWLETYPHRACGDGIKWLLAMRPKFKSISVRNLLDLCLDNDHFDYANWLITYLLDDNQNRYYGLHAAELVEHIYNEAYPNDTRVHDCNVANRRYLKNQTDSNLRLLNTAIAAAETAEWSAALSAWSTAYSAWSAALSAVEADPSIARAVIDYGYRLYTGGGE